MIHSRTFLTAAAFALLLVGMPGCDGLPIIGSDDTFSDVGTVRFTTIEGGCWSIETAKDGFQPINLPDEFKVDGLRVRFEAEVRDDLTSACQIGPLIELISIERMGEEPADSASGSGSGG